MNIHQLSVTYDAIEDRLLLRVLLDNGEELRFWLTRAQVARLDGVITTWLNPGAAAPAAAVRVFRQELAVATADFSTPPIAGKRFPLGELPVLVIACRFETAPPPLRLHLDLATQQTATLTMDDALMASLRHLLAAAIGHTGWNLTLGAIGAASPAGIQPPPRWH